MGAPAFTEAGMSERPRRPRLTENVRRGLHLLLDMGRADYEAAPENWEEADCKEIDAALKWWKNGGLSRRTR